MRTPVIATVTLLTLAAVFLTLHHTPVAPIVQFAVHEDECTEKMQA